MRFFKEFGLGFSTHKEAYRFISEQKLWGYFYLPGIINLILFAALVWVAMIIGDYWTQSLVDLFGIEDEDTKGVIFYIILIFIRILQFLLFYFTYKYIILILMAPAMAIFAQKIHTIQTGENVPFSFKQFMHDVMRGVILALKNLFWELLILVLINIIGLLITFLAPFIPIVGFFVSAYYYGFSMIDYKCELLGYTVKDSTRLIRKHKGFALGNGIMFSLILFIPFFGALIAPILSLAAAQVGFYQVVKKKQTD